MPGFLEVGSGAPISGSSGGGNAPARNSRERTAPERVDINDFVPQGFGPQLEEGEEPPLPLQALEAAGRAPGFVAERPIALADTLLSDESGNSAIDTIGQLGIGDFKPFSFAAEVVGNISALPGAIANSATADSLRRGTQEGWDDDTLVESTLDKIGRDQALSMALDTNPLSAGFSALIQELNGKKKPPTWGEFKEDAAKKGWTGQDVEDVIAGRKAVTDFGDHAMSSDPLTEAALRIGSDPLNLVFGAGAALKIASGAGLLARAVRAGAILEKPLAPSLAAAASARGIAAESTWFGLAKYFGTAGRGIGAVPGGARAIDVGARVGSATATGLRAYKKTAIGLTAGQLATNVVGDVTRDVRGGFMEPLFELNREVWDNQPLSSNSAFALFSAFHFDPFRGVARVLRAGKDIKNAAVGSGIRDDVLSALSDGDAWAGKGSRRAALDRLGGEDALNNLIVHTHAKIIQERLMRNPVLRATLSQYDSLDEAILKNQKLGEMVENILVDEYKAGRITGKGTVAALKDWHANRSGVKQGGIEFQWDGMHAVDRWVEYSGAVAPVSQIFHERGDVVMGLVDIPMSEDLLNMGSALRVAGGAEKSVPIADVRKWLSRFPQLTDDPFWAKYNLREWNGKAVPYGPMQGKLTRLAKEAPTARDFTREMSVAERAAGRDEFIAEDPAAAFDRPSQVSVSRMRPTIARRLGMTTDRVDSIQAARGDAEIATFEGNVGEALSNAGLPVDRVEQSIGAWEGSLEPSVQISMTGATLPDLRLTAALLGRAGKQDAVALAVSGPRVRELGLEPNGFEVKIALPGTSRAQLQAVNEALAREFPGYTINDTTGVVSILVPAGERATLVAALGRISPDIEGLYPQDLIGETGISTSVHPAYIEKITKQKGAGDGSYAEVIREARSSGDARADAESSVSASLAVRRATRRDAQAGVGSGEAVGRQPGDDVGQPRDLTLAPAERVGLGDLYQAKAEPGFLYHVTDEEVLLDISTGGLRPHGPNNKGADVLNWYDGGSGKRVWYTEDPAFAAQQKGADGPLLRVRKPDAGRVRSSLDTGEMYSAKKVPANHVEVFGADGQWHPMDEWFAPQLERDIVEGAQTVLPVYQASEMEIWALENYRFVAHPKGAHATPNRDLSSLIANQAPLRQPTTLYRSVFPDELEMIQAAVGDEYVVNGYVSTATTPELAAPYAGPKGTVVRVEMPAGATVLDVDATPHAMPIMEEKRLAGEYTTGEHLLPFGSRFRVREENGELVLSFEGTAGGTFDPTPDTLTAGLRAHEDQPWQAAGAPGDEAALMEELAGLSADTELGASAARAQAVQGRLEATRLAKGEAKKGSVLWAARRDAEVTSEIPLHRSLSGLDDQAKAELAQFERELREHYPAYTLQKSPNTATIMADRGDLAARYLRDRTMLGDALATWGPVGRISRFLEWLAAPVENKVMAKSARQALMNELIPHGAKPKEVDEFLARLDKEASQHTIGPFGVRVFRNGTSLTQQTINRIAAGDPEIGIAAMFSEKTINQIGRNNFARVIDRASNRFIQTLDKSEARGARGALSRASVRAYDRFAQTAAGDVSRLVSKTMYHWFRFISDPRWWAMNVLEADIIGGLKYGTGSTRFSGAHRAEVGKPALFHQLGGYADSDAFERALGDGNGWLYTRRQGGYISRSFDHQRPETVNEILRGLPEGDPIIADLKAIIQAEDLKSGRPVRTEGEILDDDMVDGIDRLLYSMDEKGAKATILDEAEQLLGLEETERLLPFLQKVWEANDKTYHDIVAMFHGNPSRSNLERIANSYWLYWPISYQVKATKWLVDVMARGAFGKQTNLAGAALYAHVVEEHRDRMASNPEYVAMFEDHPTAWFLAQMMVPVTPGDIGVSLSRPVRYSVGAGGDFLEENTGSRLGLWGSYKSAEDPITAAGAILSMGPVYTSELLARVGRELFEEPTSNLYP